VPATAPASANGRITSVLATIYGLRMFGLFMVLPLLALHAETLPDITPLLLGLAIGIYGLTQAIFQIPYGIASDRWGRRPLITLGLLIFFIGSIIAATAETAVELVAGRALQGAGAIAAAIMALAADLTPEDRRTRMMAFIGMSIGLAFIAAMVIGPLLSNWLGIAGLFWLTALLALAAILLLWITIPEPSRPRIHREAEAVNDQIRRVITDRQLLRLDLGIFVLHAILTAMFVIIPLQLRDSGLAGGDHWQIYLPVMVIAMAIAIPSLIVAERRRQLKRMLWGALLLLITSQLLLLAGHSQFFLLLLAMLIFFIGFNMLEALMPSLVSKMAPAASKGTAMGFYATAQFAGAFSGGALGGTIYGGYGANGVYLFTLLLALIWLITTLGLRNPLPRETEVINLLNWPRDHWPLICDDLRRIVGVDEATLDSKEGSLYLKIDAATVDRAALERYLAHNENQINTTV
jgi:predicted MFS family arabinose efflux permease